jgi:hypothetical protein
MGVAGPALVRRLGPLAALVGLVALWRLLRRRGRREA